MIPKPKAKQIKLDRKISAEDTIHPSLKVDIVHDTKPVRKISFQESNEELLRIMNKKAIIIEKLPASTIEKFTSNLKINKILTSDFSEES